MDARWIHHRNATVRARIEDAHAPGASVRVAVPDGPGGTAVAIPVSALRKGRTATTSSWCLQARTRSPAPVRPVESGTVLGDEVLILSGLAAGEKVHLRLLQAP